MLARSARRRRRALPLDGDAPVRARDRQVQQISRKYAVVPLPAPVSWAIDRVGLVADVTVALVSVQVPLPAVLLARPVVENTHVEECVSTAVMESRLQAVVDSWLMSAASAGVALVQAAGVGQLAVPAVPGTKPAQFVPATIVTRQQVPGTLAAAAGDARESMMTGAVHAAAPAMPAALIIWRRFSRRSTALSLPSCPMAQEYTARAGRRGDFACPPVHAP